MSAKQQQEEDCEDWCKSDRDGEPSNLNAGLKREVTQLESDVSGDYLDAEDEERGEALSVRGNFHFPVFNWNTGIHMEGLQISRVRAIFKMLPCPAIHLVWRKATGSGTVAVGVGSLIESVTGTENIGKAGLVLKALTNPEG